MLLVHLEACPEFSDLDALLIRFHAQRCVIDGLPETHETRNFVKRHSGVVFMACINEHQPAAGDWKYQEQIVQVDRAEALGASRQAFRQQRLVLPRQAPVVTEFARHMAPNPKILDEDRDTGAQKYRSIRTGPDHYSLAFTYAWMAASRFMDSIEPEVFWIGG